MRQTAVATIWAGALAACAASGGSSSTAEVADRRPNIIYIYADDLGYGELGSYGQQLIRTPNLDRMAREGMRFTQHYTGAPVCAPARAMLLTGKHAGHSYIRGNYELGGFADSLERGQMPLPEGLFTLSAMLKHAGYATGLVGKWGLGMTGTTGEPSRQGFDEYYGYLDQKQAHNYYPTHLWDNGVWDTLDNPVIAVHRRLDSTAATEADFASFIGTDYAPARMTDRALDFIERHRDEPFFLYFASTIPHVSLQAPREDIARYRGQFEERPYYGQRGYASTRYPRSTYAAMISYLDGQVGMILARLKELGLEDRTLVMFSSDNGPSSAGGADPGFFNSAAGLRGGKMELYEGGIRVPFIARWPGVIPAGSTSDLVSTQFDLLPTAAELTGQAIPVATDGISLLPELRGDRASQRQHEFLYFEYPENGGQIAVRLGDWKGVRTSVRHDPAAPWQLYNLASDRGEVRDVASQHPDLVAQLNAIQRKEHLHPHVREWEFVDPRFE